MPHLALDIGERRVGIAVSEGPQFGVFPQKTLERGSLESDLNKIVFLLEEFRIDKLVVGLPYHMNGKESLQAKKVRSFTSSLEKKIASLGLVITLEYWDERLTSWEAEQRLTQRGLKGKKRKQNVDALAACLILEDYLESKK